MRVLPVQRPSPDRTDDETIFRLASEISRFDERDKAKAPMLEAVARMHRSQTDHAFLDAFQQFMAAAAGHSTFVLPFLPALVRMVKQRP